MGIKKGPGGGILKGPLGGLSTCCCVCLHNCASPITVAFSGTPPTGYVPPPHLLMSHTLVKVSPGLWRVFYDNPFPDSDEAVTLQCTDGVILVKFFLLGVCTYTGNWSMLWDSVECPVGSAEWLNGTSSSGDCGLPPDWSWASCDIS
jgi:hypothetical protein